MTIKIKFSDPTDAMKANIVWFFCINLIFHSHIDDINYSHTLLTLRVNFHDDISY